MYTCCTVETFLIRSLNAGNIFIYYEYYYYYYSFCHTYIYIYIYYVRHTILPPYVSKLIQLK